LLVAVLSRRADRERGPRPRASAISRSTSLACAAPIFSLTWVSVRSCRVSVQSSLGSARSLSDRVGSLSDHHLAQPGLCPIVLGLCPIVTWLSQISDRSCRVSVRSSSDSAWSLSDRVGSLSDRHLAQPGLCPIVLGLYPIIILLRLFLRVVCRWPDSFCDLLFVSSFVVDL
jgi:uncharacterized protein YjeT (DUF2065 family)